MQAKVTFFFESLQQADRYASAALGWTESWYLSDNAITGIDQWFTHTDVLQYAELRLATLPATYHLQWIRISDERNPRSFKVQAYEGGGGTAITPSGSATGIRFGQVNCALLVDLSRLPDNAGDHTHHRRFLMRALPIDVISGNVVNTLGPNWRRFTAFLNWIAVKESGDVVAGPLPPGVFLPNAIGLRYQDPANAAYTPAPAVTNAAGLSNRDISVAATLAGTPGVSEYAFKDFPDEVRALNRTWRLLTTIAGPPAATILGRTRRPMPPVNYAPPGPGRFRLVTPAYGLFNQYTIIGLRNKKTGRLFRQLRGRSPNR